MKRAPWCSRADAIGHPAEERRVKPLVRRSNVNASEGSADDQDHGAGNAEILGEAVNCDVTIRPPVAIMVIMTNISQKIGERSISRGDAPCATARVSLGSNLLRTRIAQGIAPPQDPRRPGSARTGRGWAGNRRRDHPAIGMVVRSAPMP